MTSELEQEFFRVFEIEKQNEIIYTDIFDREISRERFKTYPKITAEKLLEMICICNSTYINGYTNYFTATVKTKEELKEEILKKCIALSKDIRKQIQQLFNEPHW